MGLQGTPTAKVLTITIVFSIKITTIPMAVM
jgi:hypothetical protein